MRTNKPSLGAVASGCLLAAALSFNMVAASGSAPPLVPFPKEYQSREGRFMLGPGTRMVTDAVSRPAGEFLAKRLRASTGFPVKLRVSGRPKPGKDTIVITSVPSPGGSAEGYRLTVSPEAVVINGSGPAGVFYGAQTLLQLFPPEIFSAQVRPGKEWPVPGVEINDEPRFQWRGLLIDSARHFFTKAEIKKILDSAAMLKLNRFQWHLTDDVGWRVEIKQYPALTGVGAWRKSIGFGLDPKSSTAYGPDGRYGGYYSRADLEDTVAYAQRLHITMVPEIEMPGHAGAALSAFPELSCGGGPYNTDGTGGMAAGVYCAGNEKTYEFLEGVLSEVMRLFPGQYIHIGGDEVPKDNWHKCAKCQARMKQEGLKTEQELQSYFVHRIEKFINSKGRTMVGWSEIREGGLAMNAVLMDWIGGAAESAREGHDVVMTPTAFCYLDYYQSTNQAAEPKAIGGFVPLEKAYSFEPVPAGLETQFRSHILGGQGNLWTEFIASLGHAEYMLFPRLAALAEVDWSPANARDYAGFTRRWEAHARRLDQLGVNYRKVINGSKSE